MDLSDVPDHVLLKARQLLLEGDEWGLLAINRARDDYQELTRSFIALEHIVEQQKDLDIELLKNRSRHLSEDDLSEFWAWHYPTHWDGIVTYLLRTSSITALMSFLEYSLGLICKDVQVITNEQIKAKDFRGSFIDQSKLYLSRFGDFSVEDGDAWKGVQDIYQIRNCLVHANGKIDRSSNPKRLGTIIRQATGLAENCGSILVEKDYISKCFETVDVLLSHLEAEMRAFILRAKQFGQSTRS